VKCYLLFGTATNRGITGKPVSIRTASEHVKILVAVFEGAKFMDTTAHSFDAGRIFELAGEGATKIHLSDGEIMFMQGEPAGFVLCLQSGRAKLSVNSRDAKECIVSFFDAGEFIGEESILGSDVLRIGTAAAIGPCKAIRIMRPAMSQLLKRDLALSNYFVTALLTKTQRMQALLVDQLFNPAEKRLARVLLSMAGFGGASDPGPVRLIPQISQEALAAMVGTTRSRVSFFMNRFRELGFIDYKRRIVVHKSLLTALESGSLSKANSSPEGMIVPEAGTDGQVG